MLKYIYIIMLTISFFCTNAVIGVSNSVRNLLFIIFLIMSYCFILFNSKLKEQKDEKKRKLVKILIGLYFIMLIYSIVRIIMNQLTVLISETIITIGMIIVSLLLALNTNKIFKEKNLNYIIYAIIINYLIVIIAFILRNGIGGLINFKYLNEAFIDTGLEVHELIFIMGLVFTYLLIDNKFTSKRCAEIIILAVFLYLGDKRIVMGAIAIVIFIYLMEHIVKNKHIMLTIINIGTFIMVISYLLYSTVGIEKMQSLFNKLNINMMGRNDLYTFFEGKYELSFAFLGNGMRYTEYALKNYPKMSMYGALHNDILRIYIENGMYIFLIYFITFIFIIPRYLKQKYDSITALKYSYMLLYTIICYMTDNLFTYYRYIFVFYAILFYIMDNCNKTKNQIQDKEEKV